MIYFSTHFHIQQVPSYRLVVKADYGLDEIAILDSDSQLMAYVRYQKGESVGREAEKLLGFPFPEVDVYLPHFSGVLTPEELFDESYKEEYQKFLLKEDASTQKSTLLKDWGVYLSYELDELIYLRWSKLYPHGRLIPKVVPFLEALFPLSREGAVVGLCFHEKFVDVCLVYDGALQLINTFEYSSDQDLRYYLLSLQKQSGMDGPFDRLVTQGDSFEQRGWMDGFAREVHPLKSGIACQELEDEDVKKKVDNLLYPKVLCES